MSRVWPLVLSLVALVSVSGCSSQRDDVIRPTPAGQTMPVAQRIHAGNFSGRSLSGDQLTLADNAGHITVLTFWAHWCAPCTVEMPQFDLVYRTYRSRGVNFVGVGTKDTRDGIRHFVSDNNISFPIIFDEAGKVSTAIGHVPSVSLPFTVVLDQSERIAAVYLTRVTAKDLSHALDSLISERPSR